MPKSTPVNRQKMSTTERLKARLIRELIVPEMTIMYLGNLIFLITSPLATTELNAPKVASVKNVHKIIPKRR